MKDWVKHGKSWATKVEPPVLLELVFALAIGALFFKLWWGHPDTVQSFGENAGTCLFQRGYYILLYLFLFSFSRTISLKHLYRWFYLGLCVVPFAVFVAENWVLTWDLGMIRYFGRYIGGEWSDPSSLNHAGVTGPVIEEFFKALPLFVFFVVAWRQKSLRSYTLSDWLLMGVTVGGGFHLAENILWLQESRYSLFTPDPWPNYFFEYLLPLSPLKHQFHLGDHALPYVSGTHAIWTAYAALGLGMAVWMGRRKSWLRFLAWIFPVCGFGWAVLDHGLANLTSGYSVYYNLIQSPQIRALTGPTLGGRILNYGFALLLPGIAAYEFWSIYRRKPAPLGWLRMIGRHLQMAGILVWVTLVTSWGSYFRSLLEPFRWPKLLGIPLFAIVFIVTLASRLLEYFVTQWRVARVRHAVGWSQ